MSLTIDCLAAVGTLTVAVGSGMQAYSELITFAGPARRLGVTELVGAAAEFYQAAVRLSDEPSPRKHGRSKLHLCAWLDAVFTRRGQDPRSPP